MTFLDFSKNFIKAMTQACYFHCQWVSWNSFVMNKIRFKNIHFHFLTFSSKIQHFRLSQRNLSSRSWVIFCSAPALILTLRLDEHGENIFANCECLWLRCNKDFFSENCPLEEITTWWCLVYWRMSLATSLAQTTMVTIQGKQEHKLHWSYQLDMS